MPQGGSPRHTSSDRAVPASPPSLPPSALALGSCWDPGPHCRYSCVPRSHTLISLQSRVGVFRELPGGSCLIVTPRLNVQKWQLAGAGTAPGAATCNALARSRRLNETCVLTVRWGGREAALPGGPLPARRAAQRCQHLRPVQAEPKRQMQGLRTLPSCPSNSQAPLQ